MIDEKKIDRIRTGRPFYFTDIIWVAAVVIVIAAVIAFTFMQTPSSVEVNYGGAVYTYNLSADGVYDIGGHVKLHIESGAVYVTDADCPDKICEISGKIRYAGQVIVCAPNKIFIAVKGGGGGLDGVV